MSARLLAHSARSVKTRLGKSAKRIYRPHVIRAFIFDLDGTLVDSLPGIALALNHALSDAGLPGYTEKEVVSFIGDGMAALVDRALGEKNASHREPVMAGFQKHYQEDWKTGTSVYPGIFELLETLHERGLPMAVLSNKPHPFTCEIVKALFPAHLFTPVQGHRPDFPKKPDPTTALKIVSDWGLQPEEVAYVGDSTVDLATAQAAKLIPLIFAWGYGTPPDTPLLNSAGEFLTHLDSISS